MKSKLMKLAVAALLVGGVFLGCGSNPSDNGGNGGGGVSEAFIICGPNEVWWDGEDGEGDGTAFRSNGRIEWLDICYNSMDYNRWTTGGVVGVWSLNGNQLTMDSGEEPITVLVERLSNDTIRVIFGNESVTLTKRTGITIVDSCD